MTLQQAIETVRIYLGDRNEHHPNCNSIKPPSSRRQVNIDTCDCYAYRIQVPHRAMDQIEAFINDQIGTESKPCIVIVGDLFGSKTVHGTFRNKADAKTWSLKNVGDQHSEIIDLASALRVAAGGKVG